MAYTTTSTLKSYLGITGGTDDVLLASLIDSAGAIIDRYTGRTFEASADSTRYFDALSDTDGHRLIFDEDICAITTVTNGDSVVVASDEYVTMPANETPYYGIELLMSANKSWDYTTDHQNAISVAGKWAYSQTVPDDIAHACVRLAAFLYRQKDNANDIDRAVVVGNATVLPSDLPRDVMQLITPYRKLTR